MFLFNKNAIMAFCTICKNSKTNNYSSSRFMNKILKETKIKKKWQNIDGNSSGNVPVPNALAKGAAEGKRSVNARRIAVLNKVFMRYITDLMATGNNSSLFLGRGIEINRVMVAPDFKGVNVFWVAKGSENDDEVDKLLTQNAGALRHELSQLRVMGVVPKINFIKDRQYAKLVEVDQRLSKADFGDDYVPIKPSYRFESNLYLNFSLSEAVKGQIDTLVEENFDEEEIPEMRNDIFGLNHSDIMSQIKKSMKKSQAVHRKQNENSVNLSTTVNEEPIHFDSQRQQKEAFQQFLLERQIHRAKAKKDKDKYDLEYEYIKAEHVEYPKESPFVEELKDDFIEEDENLFK